MKRALILASLAIGVTGNSIKVLSPDAGLQISAEKLRSFLQSSTQPLFTSAVLRNDDSNYKIFNEVFGTDFGSGTK